MKEICTLLVKLNIVFSRMQRVNQHARPSIIQVECPTRCYHVYALDHAKGGAADLDYHSGPCHRNEITTKLCGPSRQVASHDRVKKHDFVRNEPGKW